MPGESKKLRIVLAGVGFVVAALLAAIDPNSGSTQSFGLVAAYFILCPPVLLSIPFFVMAFEAAEYGTPLYFVIWAFVAALNGCLYAVVGPAIVRVIRKNWDFTSK